MRRWVETASAATALVLASCSSWTREPTGELARLVELTVDDRGERSAGERRRARIVIDSDEFSFTGRAVAVATRYGPPRVVLQLIPPVGGKLLEVRLGAAPSREAPDELVLSSRWSAGAEGVLTPWAGERGGATAPRRIETFLAASLAVNAANRTKATGYRRRAQGFEARRESRLPGLTVVERHDESGALTGREYRYRGVRWTETIGESERIFRGEHIVIELTEEVLEDVEARAMLFKPFEPDQDTH